MMPVAVDLWVFALDVEESERQRLQAHLSRDELERAARLVFERDRHRFTVGRGRLREILAARVRRKPGALRFSYSAHGKPSIEGVEFNLSHSEGLAALCIAGVELGVDVERVRPLKERVAERFFSRAEIEALARLPEDDQLVGFYRCWTRKEAIVKALGEGLSMPLADFSVSVDARGPLSVQFAQGRDQHELWKLESFAPAATFEGAVACRSGGAPLVLRMMQA